LYVALRLLGLVAGQRADDAVLLPLDAIGGALNVALGLSGLVLCFTSSVLLLKEGK
jgi:hypothetical protein